MGDLRGHFFIRTVFPKRDRKLFASLRRRFAGNRRLRCSPVSKSASSRAPKPSKRTCTHVHKKGVADNRAEAASVSRRFVAGRIYSRKVMWHSTRRANNLPNADRTLQRLWHALESNQ